MSDKLEKITDYILASIILLIAIVGFFITETIAFKGLVTLILITAVISVGRTYLVEILKKRLG